MREYTRVWGATLAASMAVLVSACGFSGSDTSKPSAAELMDEYVKTTDVKNDIFPTGGTKQDRVAAIAAYYSAEQLPAVLLAAEVCLEGEEECRPPAATRQAVKDFAGGSGEAFQRHVLVKREDESLELLPLFVARKPGGTAALVDTDGRTYTGGLDDFREHNDLLSADDFMLAPTGLTAVPGKGDLIVVSGHTQDGWWTRPRVAGLVVSLALAVAVAARPLVLRRRRALASEAVAEAEAAEPEPEPPNAGPGPAR